MNDNSIHLPSAELECSNSTASHLCQLLLLLLHPGKVTLQVPYVPATCTDVVVLNTHNPKKHCVPPTLPCCSSCTSCPAVIDPAHAVTTKTVLTMQNPDELTADLAASKQEYHVTDATGQAQGFCRDGKSECTAVGWYCNAVLHRVGRGWRRKQYSKINISRGVQQFPFMPV